MMYAILFVAIGIFVLFALGRMTRDHPQPPEREIAPDPGEFGCAQYDYEYRRYPKKQEPRITDPPPQTKRQHWEQWCADEREKKADEFAERVERDLFNW